MYIDGPASKGTYTREIQKKNSIKKIKQLPIRYLQNEKSKKVSKLKLFLQKHSLIWYKESSSERYILYRSFS
jgi:hypothetical protein